MKKYIFFHVIINMIFLIYFFITKKNIISPLLLTGYQVENKTASKVEDQHYLKVKDYVVVSELLSYIQ